MKILSHGGGVQTRTLLRLCLEGGFERPDLVVFADTQAEPGEVYEAIAEDKAACEAQGIEFVIVTTGELAAVDKWGGLFIPAFTLDEKGNRGMLRRQCTERFKVRPIRQLLRSRGATTKTPCELWMGISTDEALNAASMLYGAAWRAAKAMGYRRLITYTLPEEGGSSLRAAGWTVVGQSAGGTWNRNARPRVDKHPLQPKLRWEAPHA